MKIYFLSKIKKEATSHAPLNKIAKKVILRKGEIPHITQFAQGYFKPGCIAPKHKHKDMYEIFLAERGEVTFIVNDKEYVLTKGDAITIEPGDFHEVRNRGNTTVIMTYFSVLN